jgi:hypothetical protein
MLAPHAWSLASVIIATDAGDARHEDHGGRHDPRDHLRGMTCPDSGKDSAPSGGSLPDSATPLASH